MDTAFQRSYRGMQVHAVPENERAYDHAGNQLPWGYSSSSTGGSNRDFDQMEKGPFGRSMRRARGGVSRSRSKTGEPKREEDRIRAEQLVAEDAVFGSLRKIVKDDGRHETVGDADIKSQSPPGGLDAAGTGYNGEQEPTEVILYGFGEDLQWAAIDFYERVSNGLILEDYERAPPNQRQTDLTRSYGRMAAQRRLSKAALKKKNRYAGGNHWIKVTFESRLAAELACARSPHIIKGHLVYAEPYQGRGPGRDEAVAATQAGARITNPHFPATFSSQTTAKTSPSASHSASATLTSATATEVPVEQPSSRRVASGSDSSTWPSENPPVAPEPASALSVDPNNAVSPPSPPHPQSSSSSSRQRPRLRIQGAIPLAVLPAEQALMPKQPKPSWFASFGARELIGTTVPKTESGAFDWELASLYWRLFWIIDLLLGTDLCGIRGGDD